MFGYLAFRIVTHSEHVTNPPPPEGPRAAELEDRIDPNRADWTALAALPTIGEKRAKDIVAYREQFVSVNPDKRAFAVPSDLLNIRGIGPATLSQIEPFLIFPSSPPPSSQPL